ncbi:hypothetical protein ACNI3T_00730 [Christiangramia sp. ASW11-125]|uniref:hypothetical protein n=1 Tax=Christiangramia sp. ASW11-125 TaxID=3400701 RepID=UPI003AAD0591
MIIRSCVQIEVFFKELGKYYCSNVQDSSLAKKYNQINKKTGEKRGVKNWNFGDYHIFKERYLKYGFLFVRPLNQNIKPFENWQNEKNAPHWWNVYNAIKHDGINSKKDATLKVALNSLAALFLLHCSHRYSRRYLLQFSNQNIDERFDFVEIKFNQITSPLDTKRYLFKDIAGSSGRTVKVLKFPEGL